MGQIYTYVCYFVSVMMLYYGYNHHSTPAIMLGAAFFVVASVWIFSDKKQKDKNSDKKSNISKNANSGKKYSKPKKYKRK